MKNYFDLKGHVAVVTGASTGLGLQMAKAFAKRSIPLERHGRSGELDTCALFLASPASTYVTGQNIAVDGGYTCV